MTGGNVFLRARMVPVVGLEPTRPLGHKILSLVFSGWYSAFWWVRGLVLGRGLALVPPVVEAEHQFYGLKVVGVEGVLKLGFGEADAILSRWCLGKVIRQGGADLDQVCRLWRDVVSQVGHDDGERVFYLSPFEETLENTRAIGAGESTRSGEYQRAGAAVYAGDFLEVLLGVASLHPYSQCFGKSGAVGVFGFHVGKMPRK